MTEPLKRVCVIGWPIGHSRSPVIHTHWLEVHGLEGLYSRMAVPEHEIDAFLQGLERHGYCGANVTIPHKEAAYKNAARRTGTAQTLGVANTLWFEDGELWADNTDGYGFLANLDAGAPGWDQNPETALVLGAGGASRAIVHGLIGRGYKSVCVANRSLDKAEALREQFGENVLPISWDARHSVLPSASLLVNTTSLGMKDQPDLEFDLSEASDGLVVTDIVYAPLRTRLLDEAAAKGLRTVDGLGMLLHQAVPGFERWFGVRPEVTDTLRQLVLKDMGLGT
ncbi:shikimate dehydrogenase [Coralliovum pocilloporae]|uniref:shikimate dehydrogenase n=1 Tax=Coralliovum pocilloporae TaxID=3066369 RepID=UPI0033078F17